MSPIWWELWNKQTAVKGAGAFKTAREKLRNGGNALGSRPVSGHIWRETFIYMHIRVYVEVFVWSC